MENFKMTTRDMAQVMVDMQDSINKKIHPEWRDQDYPWYRAIWIECAELMDHLGYKWWKQQDIDDNQIKLEIVDIWHFGLSEILEIHGDDTVNSIADGIGYLLKWREKREIKKDPLLETVEIFAFETLELEIFCIDEFVKLMYDADMSYEELYRLYVAKNVLNDFRQKKGYSTGEYNKIWNGKEDNEVLMEILGDSVIPPEQIYLALESHYSTLN